MEASEIRWSKPKKNNYNRKCVMFTENGWRKQIHYFKLTYRLLTGQNMNVKVMLSISYKKGQIILYTDQGADW